MIVLALDTSTCVSSVALLNHKGGVVEKSEPVKHHSERILPLIERVLAEAGVRLEEVEGIACGQGPGSFTGLRIGLATAKGLCYATRRPLVMVSSLQALAMNVASGERWVAPVIDAKKQEVFAGLYEMTTAGPVGRGREVVLPPARLREQIDPERVLLVGEGAVVYREVFAGYRVFEGDNQLQAGRIAELALVRLRKGEPDDLARAAPVYIRASDAELKPRQRADS